MMCKRQSVTQRANIGEEREDIQYSTQGLDAGRMLGCAQTFFPDITSRNG